MENATNALYIAAGVLLGVLILTFAVALFAMFGNSSKEIIEQIDASKITEFNNNFLKFYNNEVKIDAYDLVTMANFARKNNKEMLVDSESGANANSFSDYIQIVLKYYPTGANPVKIENNFEKQSETWYNSFLKSQYLKKDSSTEKREYKITSDPIINKKTKKVIKIEITEII